MSLVKPSLNAYALILRTNTLTRGSALSQVILLVIAEVIPEETKIQTVSRGVKDDVNTSN